MDSAEHSAVALSIETDYGIFTAHYSEVGLAALNFPDKSTKTRPPEKLSPELESWRTLTENALRDSLRGKRVGTLPPLDLKGGTVFQRRVWKGLLTIKPGEVMTYAELAAAILHPAAVRAVGSACGANPIPVIIPCHRILAAKRKLGGFSAGLRWKELLLTIEGHAEFGVLSAQMSLFAQRRSDKNNQ